MTLETDTRTWWVTWTSIAAIAGNLFWMLVPWIQMAVLGDHPYVASVFDVLSLVAWVSMAAGLLGFHTVFHRHYGRIGQFGVGLAGFGMTVVAGLLLRSVITFVQAGFRAVPATGEDPAGLLISLGTLIGLGFTLLGAGAIGIALLRIGGTHVAGIALLLSAPTVPIVFVVLRVSSLLPTPIGRIVVMTNAVLLPFGVAWLALGILIWTHSRDARTDVIPTGSQ